MWVRVLGIALLGPLQGCNQGWAGFFYGAVSVFTWLSAAFSSWQAARLRAKFFCWLWASGHPQLCAMWAAPSMAACSTNQQGGECGSKTGITFYEIYSCTHKHLHVIVIVVFCWLEASYTLCSCLGGRLWKGMDTRRYYVHSARIWLWYYSIILWFILWFLEELILLFISSADMVDSFLVCFIIFNYEILDGILSMVLLLGTFLMLISYLGEVWN